MNLDEFINKYNGKPVDFDGVYGAQCVDLFRQYAKEVLCIPEHTGPVEGAKDLYKNYKNMPKEQLYFDRVPASQKLKCGDVVVYDSTPTNKYGHVAILLGDTGEGLLVFEQNGFTQDGAKIVLRSRYNLLGALRRNNGR